MSAWWLVVIVPLFATVGFLFGEIRGSSKELDRRDAELAKTYLQKPAEAVTVKARRDIPLEVWMDRIEQTDAKTASAQLQLSMAQQLASELAPHVAVGYVFDQKARVYKVWGDARVLPLEEWK